MPSLACPGCSRKLKFADDVAGKRVRCPGCGQILRIPVAAGPGVAAPPTRPAAPKPASIKRAKPDDPGGHVTVAPSLHGDATLTGSPGSASASPPPRQLTDFLASPQTDDELGRLGPYRVLKVLGHGGMGVVFLAEDAKLQRKVALKAMLPSVAQNESSAKRFVREAQAMALVKHVHVATIYQVDEDRGVPYLAMEFLTGEPLDALLKRQPILPIPEVLRIGREIAEGLAAAHHRGLIHRDIKPGNIWLETDDAHPQRPAVVKILDFGLARAGDSDVHLTQSGAIVGTPAYMAPEQARGAVVDGRCDLFSLGVVLYRMATGQMPFKGVDTISTLMAIASDEPPSPETLNAEIPAEVSDLILKLLAKDPADRYLSALDVASAITAMEAAPTMHRDAGTTARPATKSRATQRKLPWKWIAAGLLGIAGTLFTWQIIVRAPLSVKQSPNQSGVHQEVQSGPGNSGDGTPAAASSPAFALAFDGRESYVQTDRSNEIKSKAYTIEAWIVPTAPPIIDLNTGRQGHIYRNLASPYSPYALSLQLSGNKEDNAFHWTLVGKRVVANEFFVIDSTDTVEFGRRYHVVGEFDGQVFSLYVDGRKQGDGVRLAAPQDSVPIPFLIGGHERETIEPSLVGRIEQFRLSSKARYLADFDSPRELPKDADTLVSYRFDEGKGDILHDSSGNGHDGKIVQAKWVKSDGSPLVRLNKLPEPELAIAPFDPALAAKHQKAWADYAKQSVVEKSRTGIEMVLIPPGGGKMSQPWRLGKYEVTQAQFTRVMGWNPSYCQGENAKGADPKTLPVENVRWYVAVEFCNELSELEMRKRYYEIKVHKREGKEIVEAEVKILGGDGYRLPTEREWEYACRAGSDSRFGYSDREEDLDNYGWYEKNSDGRSHKVGEKLPNGFGLYDMHGNANEWCWDLDHSGALERAARGGGWHSSTGLCSVGHRHGGLPAHRNYDVGIRLARGPSLSEP